MMKRVRTTLQRASKVVEAPRRRTEDVVRRLAENPEFDLMDAPGMARELLHIGKEQAERVRSLLDERIRSRLSNIGLATQDDVDRLKRRIAELEASAASKEPAGGTAATAEEVTPPRRSAAARGRARPATAGRSGAAQPGAGPAGTAGPAGSGGRASTRSAAERPARGRASAPTAGGGAGEPPDRAGAGHPGRRPRTSPARGRAPVAPGEPADRAGGGAEPDGGAGE
jgi:polyhydroxyalkanoate synthesis regulator phasin